MNDFTGVPLHHTDVILIPVHNRRETTLSCLSNQRSADRETATGQRDGHGMTF